jgi:hypothetical protein
VCLDTLTLKRRRGGRGIGYKLVRKFSGGYSPFWHSMINMEEVRPNQNSKGYCGSFDNAGLSTYSDLGCHYELGKTYNVPHHLISWSNYGRPQIAGYKHGVPIYKKAFSYHAGVHLYKECPAAVRAESLYAVIKCRYEKAVAEDENTIVALRITPIEEMPCLKEPASVEEPKR